jgi:hypothetical protein
MGVNWTFLYVMHNVEGILLMKKQHCESIFYFLKVFVTSCSWQTRKFATIRLQLCNCQLQGLEKVEAWVIKIRINGIYEQLCEFILLQPCEWFELGTNV